MYICPTCKKIFDTEEKIVKHHLQCWREYNPYHKSTPAPRSEDMVETVINEDVANFFASLQKRSS